MNKSRRKEVLDNMEYLRGKTHSRITESPYGVYVDNKLILGYKELEDAYYNAAWTLFEAEESLRRAGYTDEQCLILESNARNTFEYI